MIVPMKKAQIVVLKEDREKLLENLQKNEVLMLISSGEKELSVDLSYEDETLKKAEESLEIIKKFREKPKFVREEFIVDYDTFSSDDSRRLELLDLIEANDAKISELIAENETLNSEIMFYEPWINLETILSELDNPKYARVHTGFIENQKLSKLTDYIDSIGGVYQVLSSSTRESALIFAGFINDDKELMDFVKTVGFNEINFPKVDKTTSDLIKDIEDKVKRNLEKIENLNDELKTYSEEIKEILLLTDKIASGKDLKTAPVEETYSAIYLVGWVRSDELEKLEKTIKNTTEYYDLEYLEPADDEVVPTAVKNNKLVSAFEPITNMYSIANSNEVDPNPVMGFWYWMIFGMMMGDAGYGAVLAILMIVLIKAKKPKGNTFKVYKMFFYGAIATVIWGIVFNSFFGYPVFKKAILNPTEDILQFMILSLIVGGLHLISGFLIKAYANIRQGKLLDAIFDSFSIIFLIVGVGLLFVPGLSLVGQALAITGVVIIALTHGRKNKNIFGKIGGGLYSLYNSSVGIFSDILSYTRILALSLSSAMIAFVMNVLAEMLQGNIAGIIFSIFVYIIGHAFNLAMGLLSAYVHDSRLQYIEFFGKFYEGGGVEFKPLSMKLKHIDKIKIEKVEI